VCVLRWCGEGVTAVLGAGQGPQDGDDGEGFERGCPVMSRV
jgi:hypothetical protein